MKKYQSSYVLKQIKKKRIFEKKIHMDFPYGFSIQLDTRKFKTFGGAITTRSQNGFVTTYHIDKYNFPDNRGYLWSTVSSQKRRNGYLQSTVTSRKSGLLRSSELYLKPRSRLRMTLAVGETLKPSHNTKQTSRISFKYLFMNESTLTWYQQ